MSRTILNQMYNAYLGLISKVYDFQKNWTVKHELQKLIGLTFKTDLFFKIFV